MKSAQNEELSLRLQGLEQTVLAFTKEKDQSMQRLIELTNMLHKRSVETENEKKDLRKQIDAIQSDI